MDLQNLKIKNSKAISPVIGTILMVAITIVISGVAIAVLYGFLTNPTRGYTVTFQLVDQKPDDFTLLFYGGPDIEYVEGVKIMVNNVVYVDYSGSLSVGDQWYFKDGEYVDGKGNTSQIVSLSPGKNDDHLIVVVKFPNNLETVMVDTYV